MAENFNDLYDELDAIEDWEIKQKNDLVQGIIKYCEDYQKARRITIKYIEELKKCGLDVKKFEIRKEK